MSTVTRFVDVHLADGFWVTPGEVPDEMRDDVQSKDPDWQGWKPIPSTVTRDELLKLERELGVQLPEPTRAFFLYLHFLELNAPGIRFCAHPPRWREAIREHLDIESQLFVIGDDDNDGGPLCIDLSKRRSDGDCPVVFVDHETGERTLRFESTAQMFSVGT